MQRSVAFLAFIIVMILVLNIVASKPIQLSQAYLININQINLRDAATGNSNNVGIDISINQFEYFYVD